MKTDRRYQALLALFGLVVACAAMSAMRWTTGWMAAFWAMCCSHLAMLGEEFASGLALVSRATIVLIVLFGLAVLGRRLWKTYRFVSTLTAVPAAAPSKRLGKLLQELDLHRPVLMLVTDVPLAFSFGLLQPRICISTGLAAILSDKELKAVLLHEDHHCRHYDPLRRLLADVLAATLFFLPISAELRELFLTATELEADRHAVRLVGRPSLAGALHKILTHPQAAHLAVPGIAGIGATEIRIAELLGDSPRTMQLSPSSLMTSSFILMLGCMLIL
jgi:Zn-dependent protease with chaperone function